MTHRDSSTRRAARGSLRGKLILAPDWDSAPTNQAIADEFLRTVLKGQ